MHYTLPWMLRLSIQAHWEGRTDFYIGCNMFLYYAYEQAEEVIQEVRRRRRRARFKGPDLFLVRGVEDADRPRPYWAVWREEGRYPDLIVEFLSPSTAQNDKTHKKELYATVFRTPEYFWYDPFTQEFAGFRLAMFPDWHYEPIAPNEQGWLWSEVLGAYMGTWRASSTGASRLGCACTTRRATWCCLARSARRSCAGGAGASARRGGRTARCGTGGGAEATAGWLAHATFIEQTQSFQLRLAQLCVGTNFAYPSRNLPRPTTTAEPLPQGDAAQRDAPLPRR
jgi:Uma2 family endonuclease